MNIAGRIILFLSVVTLCNMQSVWAYETDTHAYISAEVYERSVLDTEVGEEQRLGPSVPQKLHNINLLNSLGLWRLIKKSLESNTGQPNIFGDEYFDMGFVNKKRRWDKYEQKRMPKDIREQLHLTIKGWLMRGVIREDDLGYYPSFLSISGDKIEPEQPYDDPERDITRVLHHFYDPANDRALVGNDFVETTGIASFLTRDGLLATTKAVDWAIGSNDAFMQPNTPNKNRRNHFTVFDAQEAMYRALTGWSNDTSSSVEVALTELDRNAYWATTFRALGDVIHSIQDMAQPQHTRNEVHTPKSSYTRKIYELYMNARAIQNENFRVSGESVPLNDLKYGDYPIPVFDKYSDIWSTAKEDTLAFGKGLADYSNRGFFSATTNLMHNSYEYPSNNVSSYTTRSVTAVNPETYANPTVKATVFEGIVSDFLFTERTEVAGLTSESLVTRYRANSSRNYFLTTYNYDQMAKLLIPRAVSYSAGLIDFFFRGRLQVLESVETMIDGQMKYKIVVKNTSDGYTFKNGEFEFYYTTKNNALPPGSGVNIVTQTAGSKVKLPIATGWFLSETDVLLPGETRELILDAGPGADIDTTVPENLTLVFTGFTEIENDQGVKVQEHVIAGQVYSRPLLTFSDDGFEAGTLKISRSSDQGDTWIEPTLENLPVEPGLIIEGCSYTGNTSLYCFGGIDQSGVFKYRVFRSDDAGITWTMEIDAAPAPKWGGVSLPYLHQEYVGDNEMITLRVDRSDFHYDFQQTVDCIEPIPCRSWKKFRVHKSSDPHPLNLGKTWKELALIERLFYPGPITYIGRHGEREKGKEDSQGNPIFYKSYVFLSGYYEEYYDSNNNLAYRQTLALLRSDDDGQTWKVRYIFKDPIPIVTAEWFVDPDMNYNLVYLGGPKSAERFLINYTGSDEFNIRTNRFYRSDDGGYGWKEVSNVPLELPSSSPFTAYPSPPVPHVDGKLIHLGGNVVFSSQVIPVDNAPLIFSYPYLQLSKDFISYDGGELWTQTDPGIDTAITGSPPYSTIKYFPYVYSGDAGTILDRYDPVK